MPFCLQMLSLQAQLFFFSQQPIYSYLLATQKPHNVRVMKIWHNLLNSFLVWFRFSIKNCPFFEDLLERVEQEEGKVIIFALMTAINKL